MRELIASETQHVSGGFVNTQALLATTLGGMILGGAAGGYVAMQFAMSSASQVVITPLIAACCAGFGGTTGFGLGLAL